MARRAAADHRSAAVPRAPSFALAIVVVLATGARARAQDATLRSARVRVDCPEPDGEEVRACVANASYDLEAHRPVALVVRGDVRVDGRPATSTVRLGRGQRARVELRYRPVLDMRPRPPESEGFLDLVVMPPLVVRHLVLGEHRRPADLEMPVGRILLARGRGLAFHGELRLEDHVRRGHLEPDAYASRWSTSVAVHIFQEAPEEGVVTSGGPVLGLGGWVGFSGPATDVRFALRAGYELAIYDYALAAVAFETDFDSIAESVVFGVASPMIWFLLPSVTAGVGVVARQLGPREADAALRLRVGASYPIVGVTLDFDYWPAIGEWRGAFYGRVSI